MNVDIGVFKKTEGQTYKHTDKPTETKTLTAAGVVAAVHKQTDKQTRTKIL